MIHDELEESLSETMKTPLTSRWWLIVLIGLIPTPITWVWALYLWVRRLNWRHRSYAAATYMTIQVALLIVIAWQATQAFEVAGGSMDPTLGDGDLVLSTRWFGDYEFGDLVVFQIPGGNDALTIKRVIGVPGNEIDIRGGQVFISGAALVEEGTTRLSGGLNFPVIVPEDSYFVLGDNRGRSNDSRTWGFVNSDLITGQVIARYWPPSDFTMRFPLR
jgi:signal peptidase I